MIEELYIWYLVSIYMADIYYSKDYNISSVLLT